MNTPQNTFKATYKDKVSEFNRTFMEYIRVARGYLDHTGAPTTVPPPRERMTFDDLGFPRVPCLLGYNKAEYEELYSEFLDRHYRESSVSHQNVYLIGFRPQNSPPEVERLRSHTQISGITPAPMSMSPVVLLALSSRMGAI